MPDTKIFLKCIFKLLLLLYRNWMQCSAFHFFCNPYPLHDSWSTLGLAADSSTLLPSLRVYPGVSLLHGSMNFKCVFLLMECASPSGANSVKNVVIKNPKILHWATFEPAAHDFIWFFDNIQFLKKETRHNFVNIAKITIGQKQKILYLFSHFLCCGSDKINFDDNFWRHWLVRFFCSFALVLLWISLTNRWRVKGTLYIKILVLSLL